MVVGVFLPLVGLEEGFSEQGRVMDLLLVVLLQCVSVDVADGAACQQEREAPENEHVFELLFHFVAF